MKLIDKDALVAEIEKRRDAALIRQHNLEAIGQETILNEMEANELNRIITFINNLEVKEVDLEKEAERFVQTKEFIYSTESPVIVTAKHFFELGLKANQENNVIGTFEREVKIDAGGYPYIDCDIEFYDYDKDIPLAKKGDKVKIVVIKGE